MSVKKQLSNDLSFICISKAANPKRIEKAKSYPAIAISKEEFELIFSISEYRLNELEMLYDLSIPTGFRIAKPLNNFNQNIELESFSFDNDNKYIVNLYNASCTCKDFEKSQRNQYKNGDIRRFCKHLTDVYKNNFGTDGLSDLNKFIINDGFTVKNKTSSFILEKSPSKIFVNYDTTAEWWNIFMKNDKGEFVRYGYSPVEKRFAYNEKPIGLVPALRAKLEELSNPQSVINTKKQVPKKNVVIDPPKGCATTILSLLVIITLIYLMC